MSLTQGFVVLSIIWCGCWIAAYCFLALMLWGLDEEPQSFRRYLLHALYVVFGPFFGRFLTADEEEKRCTLMVSHIGNPCVECGIRFFTRDDGKIFAIASTRKR